MNWKQILTDETIDLIFAIIQSLIIAFISGYIINKAFIKQKKLGKNLNSYGIDRVGLGKGTLNESDRSRLFGLHNNPLPTEISLCFLTGINFFNDYYDYIKQVVNKGTVVRVLLQNPIKSSLFGLYDASQLRYKDLDAVAEYYYKIYTNDKESLENAVFSETSFVMLTTEKFNKFFHNKEHCIQQIKKQLMLEGDHISNIFEATKKLEEINSSASNGGKIEIRYYNNEYRMPMIFAKFMDKNELHTLFWTNLNAPIREAMESVNVYCEQKEREDAFYVQDVKKSFEYLFAKYHHTSSNQNYLFNKLAEMNDSI